MSSNFVRFLALIVLALAYPLSLFLPARYGFENGPIEVSQNFILIVGGVQAGILALKSKSGWGWLWAAVIPIWLICLARELSWGAVFFPPLEMSESGPVYSSRILSYRPVVPLIVAALVFLSAFLVYKNRLWTLAEDVKSTRQFPLFDLAMTVVSLLLMSAAEGKIGLSLDRYIAHGQIFEEISELAAYIFLLSAQQKIRFASLSSRENHSRPAAPP